MKRSLELIGLWSVGTTKGPNQLDYTYGLFVPVIFGYLSIFAGGRGCGGTGSRANPGKQSRPRLQRCVSFFLLVLRAAPKSYFVYAALQIASSQE